MVQTMDQSDFKLWARGVMTDETNKLADYRVRKAIQNAILGLFQPEAPEWVVPGKEIRAIAVLMNLVATTATAAPAEGTVETVE